jgi:hypothetical protein
MITVEIVLIEGSPNGVRIADIKNRTIKGILVPRNKIKEINQFNQYQKQYLYGEDSNRNTRGVYFLIQRAEANIKPIVYVGKSADCFDRIQSSHEKKKDFWDIAIIFLSKNNSFSLADISYLEHLSYIEIIKASRYKADNQGTPEHGSLNEHSKRDLEDIFGTMKKIISTLGFPLFETISKPILDNIFYCSGRGISAKGIIADDGFIVLKESEMVLSNTSCRSNNIRIDLEKEKIIQRYKDKYVFLQNYLFTSPSAAASVILGRQSNGRIEWKKENGQTLADYQS